MSNTIINMTGRGLRGESAADVARRIYDLPAGTSDEEALSAAFAESGSDALSNLGGQAFDQRTSQIFEGLPILSTKTDAADKLIEITTRAGVHVLQPDGTFRLSGTTPQPRYLPNMPEGVAVPADARICYVLVSAGQSLREGVMPAAEGSVIASTPIYPGFSLMPSTGIRLKTRNASGTTQPPAGPIFTTLVNAVEAADVPIECYETPATSAASHLIAMVHAATGRYITVASMVCALGSSGLTDLKRGSATYAWLLHGLRDMVAAVRARGMRPVLLPIDWADTETDSAEGTPAALLAAGLIQFVRNLNEDWRQIVGQPAVVQLLASPTQWPAGAVENNMIRAQQTAAEREPLLLLGEGYNEMPRTTGQPIHNNATGANRTGAVVARGIYDAVFGPGHVSMQPDDWWFEPGRASLTLQFPRPVTFDMTGADVTTSGLPAGNYRGFVFDDRAGSPPTVTGHTLSGDGLFLTLTLSGASSGPRPRLGYATQRNVGGTFGPVTGMRGLLRSTRTPVASLYESHDIYEWVRPFILDIWS